MRPDLRGHPDCPSPASQDTAGHLPEPEPHLPGPAGVWGTGEARVLQSQSQARPFQPQLHGGQGAPRRDPEGQCERPSVAEPLVSQEFL